MDIHLLDAAPTTAERAAVEHVLGPPAGGWDGGARDSDRQGHSLRGGGHDARSRRHLLLPVLLAVQEHVGWISPGALNHIAERLTVPPADVYGVATFYALLSVEPRPARVAARVRGPGLPLQRLAGADRAARGAPRPRGRAQRSTAPARGCAARASGSATAHRPRS